MSTWWVIAAVLLGLWALSAGAMMLFAHRLPPGLFRYAARSVPRDVVLDAWPADPRLLERLLGR